MLGQARDVSSTRGRAGAACAEAGTQVAGQRPEVGGRGRGLPEQIGVEGPPGWCVRRGAGGRQIYTTQVSHELCPGGRSRVRRSVKEFVSHQSKNSQ